VNKREDRLAFKKLSLPSASHATPCFTLSYAFIVLPFWPSKMKQVMGTVYRAAKIMFLVV
jgi:hypothetical protein